MTISKYITYWSVVDRGVFSPQAVCSLQPLMCHVHFLDGSVKAIAINPAETVASIMCRIQVMLSLKDNHGWALYEVGDATLGQSTWNHPVYDGSINHPEFMSEIFSFFLAWLQEGLHFWLYLYTV